MMDYRTASDEEQGAAVPARERGPIRPPKADSVLGTLLRLICFALTTVLLALLAAPLARPLGALLSPDAAASDAADSSGAVLASVLYYAYLCLTLIGASVLCLMLFDRGRLRALGLWHRGALREIGQGLLLALLAMSTLFWGPLLLGWSGGLRSSTWSPAELTATVGLLFFAAAFEELLFRGYAFMVLVAGAGPLFAVGSTSILFGLAHAGNPDAGALSTINTMLAGAVLAVAWLRTASLWLPIALHFGWNAAMGLLYGMPVSGLELPLSLLRWGEVARGPVAELLFGGEYGPEAGAGLTLVALVLLIWMQRTPRLRIASGCRPLEEVARHLVGGDSDSDPSSV